MSVQQSWFIKASRVLAGERPPFVLCYHGVGEVAHANDPHGLFVTSELFESHLDLIEARGYRLVALSELWQRIEQGQNVERLGSLTFDDGLTRTVETAMPILQARNIVSSMFLPSGLLGAAHPALGGEERIIGRSQVRDLLDLGVEVGAHSVDHVRLTTVGYGEALEQMRRSKGELEDLLSIPVTSMAYPFGALNDETIAAAGVAGYEIACGCSGPAPLRALAAPREPVFQTASDLRLSLKLLGLYGPAYRVAGARRRSRA
jgi:peptidoglycan/xylan/chitin deacetylase (PgdA/CDA1 family)